MERDTNQMSQSPSLCRSGCGFYGNPSSDGLCSKCYRDALKRKQAAPTTAPSSMESSTSAIKTLISNATSNLSAITAQESTSSELSAEAKIESNKDLPKADGNDISTQSTTSPLPSTSSEAPKSEKKKKTKCAKCKVNVGVIAFPCRCGSIFCGTHRYASEHSCTFDYKEHGAEEIRKNNPQVIGEKLQKI